MKTSLLRHSLLLALGLCASNAALAQHDHAQHAGQAGSTAQEPADPHAGHAPPANQATSDHPQMDHAQMDHSRMNHAQMDHPKSDHASMDHSRMDHAQPPATDHPSMDHSTHAAPTHVHGDAAPLLPREPIPTLTDADRAAAFPVLSSHDMSHGPTLHSFVLFDRLEVWDADPGTGQAWEAQAWFGGDINRLWLRSAGERSGGHTESSNLEVLYGRSISPWWDVVTGIRHDFNPGDSRSWAALGIQGMAPYKFEVSATAYVGESGHTAASLEAEYELLLTNRLILQPLVELQFNGKTDPVRHLGSGLSKAEAGLRLRYEFNRRFAPYVGVVHERVFGRTADFHRAEGEDVRDTRVVAGIRFWF